MAWGIKEWFGSSIDRLKPSERKQMAEDALSNKAVGEINRQCPFIQHLMPGEICNKRGGVCTIIEYDSVAEKLPAAVCPRRLLEQDSAGNDVFDLLAKECFGIEAGKEYAVIREVPFLLKVDGEGNARSAKAGRIDWVLVADIENPATDWLAIETQAVYFSGDSMTGDFEMIRLDPDHLHVTPGARRPDWRSSAAKRLSPQLEDKQPVMIRWGKKVAVIVDEGFFQEFAAFQHDHVDFDNADVVWVVAGYDSNMRIVLRIERYAELEESIKAMSATRPVKKQVFEQDLAWHVTHQSSKVHFKIVP